MPPKHHQACGRYPNQMPEALLSSCGSSSSTLSSSPYLQGLAQPPYGRKSFCIHDLPIHFAFTCQKKPKTKKDLEINYDQSTLSWLRTVVLDLDVLLFIWATAHLAASCPSNIWMLVNINKSKKMTSSTKNRGEIKSTKNPTFTNTEAELMRAT